MYGDSGHVLDAVTMDGTCLACGLHVIADEDEPCRNLSGAFRIVDPTRPGHQEVQVFVGRFEGSRGNAGKLTVRVEELPWFLNRLRRAGFDHLPDLYPDGHPRGVGSW